MIRAVVFDLWNTLVFSPAGSPFQRLKELLRPDQAHLYADLVRDGMVQPYPSVQDFLGTWKDSAHFDEAQLKAMAAGLPGGRRAGGMFSRNPRGRGRRARSGAGGDAFQYPDLRSGAARPAWHHSSASARGS